MERESIFKGISFMFIMFLIVCIFVVFHETTHKAIFEMVGCEVTEVHYGINNYVRANCPAGNAEHKADILNGINEIVGYNIVPFLILIVAILLIKEKNA